MQVDEAELSPSAILNYMCTTSKEQSWNQHRTSQKTSVAILSLELPNSIEDKLLSISSAFSLKFVTLNSGFIEKVRRLSDEKATIGRDLSLIMENVHMGTMTLCCQSAFFQGILYYMSSDCAVIKDFVSDNLLTMFLPASGLDGTYSL